MLYDKWNKSEFSEELFKNPTAEFRGAPFWAWNSSLDEDALCEQIDIFKEMGFGGFNMHVRQGLETPYLGDEFFGAVKACIKRAEDNEMLAWLYDEDRWPSGAAGGLVTKTKKHRMKYIGITPNKVDNAVYDYHDAIETGTPVFLAAFSLDIAEDGTLASYRRVGEDEECENKRYCYCVTARGGELRFNFQSYFDILSKEAVDCFKEITYEAYKREVGDKFGKSVPAIFTDEPQTKSSDRLISGKSLKGVNSAWTWDFHETFERAYGFNIIDRLPEIFYKTKDQSSDRTRYYYYRHISDRYNEAFSDNLGGWCEDNGILFTGHVMYEDSLDQIAQWSYDPMRIYRSMQLPGIDVLADKRLFTVAKQCDSVVRQMGKCGMLSELYGVTGWDFDFRGHKSQGDWQAALGVTVRVPHLSWQTMKGEGKRDYPASIHYQSPWYKEYKMIEDHYARVATALTRGKAVSHVAVVHPIETYWMKKCSRSESTAECEELDLNFEETAKWLLFGSVNFDYIAESILEELCKNPTCPLKVGEMEYDAVILDNCETLRPYTVEALKKFAIAGGKLIISGRAPHLCLAEESEEAAELLKLASVIPHSKTAILNAVAPYRDVIIRNSDEIPNNDYIYTRKTEGTFDWLFICRGYKSELANIPEKANLLITVNGLYRVTVYNTFTGKTEKITYTAKDGKTNILAHLYDLDSLLLRLDKIDAEEAYTVPKVKIEKTPIKVPYITDYKLSEPNVLMLDIAKWQIDDGELHDEEELMRVDEAVRTQLNLPLKRTKMVQPWAVADAPEANRLYLRFSFRSEIEYEGAELAVENLEKLTIKFNGEAVDSTAIGYYVDKEIRTCRLPKIVIGENILEISMPFGLRTDPENCFILGDFGTRIRGREAYITELPKDIAYGDVSTQGFSFYGANIEYESEFSLDEDAAVEFEISHYRGALIKVEIDGAAVGYIWNAPFHLESDILSAGNHKVKYTLYGNRYNTFSALHNITADKKYVYIGPDFWRSEGFAWAYEYTTRPMGILKTPIINKLYKNS